MRFRPFALAPLLLLAACTATAPSTEKEPVSPAAALPPTSAEPDTVALAAPVPPGEASRATLPDADTGREPVYGDVPAADSLAVDPLYTSSEDALRLAFTDGMFGLYRAETQPADARRLDRDEIETWLTSLALVSPRAVEFARATLGPVLAQRFVVGLLLEDAAQAECASVRDVLFIPVPERYQGPDRAFNGYIIQDECNVSSGDLALFCTGGFGTAASGAACGCTCTTGEAPAQPCVTC